MNLFDPDPYGPGKVARVYNRKRAEPNTTFDPSWFVLGQKDRQPDGKFHRMKAVLNEFGGVITQCGEIGRRIDVESSIDPCAPIVACERCLRPRPNEATA